MLTTDRPPRAVLHDQAKLRAWVIYRLALKGTSLAALAQQRGVTRHTLYKPFVMPYPKSERAIAGALGLRPEQLWPDRYGPDGRSNRTRGPQTRKKSTHGNKNISGDRPRNVSAGAANGHGATD